jgi:hypothetical protein
MIDFDGLCVRVVVGVRRRVYPRRLRRWVSERTFYRNDRRGER